MKIGIDATMMVYQGSGVANYTYNLIKNLLIHDDKNQYFIFYSSLRKPPETLEKLSQLKKLGGQVFITHLPPRVLTLIWGRLNLIPLEWFIGKCQLIFFSDFLRPPTLPETRGITTIHDLTWQLYPQYHTQEVIEAHQRKIDKTLKYNDLIIVDSQNTKKDLINLYPKVNRNRIFVIYPGVDERFVNFRRKSLQEEEKNIKKYLPSGFQLGNYLVYVGAIEPRKNLEKAISVFNELTRTSTEKKIKELKFFIIGKAGWKNEQVFSLVRKLKLEEKVIFLGYVKDEDLPFFYTRASATIYLSEYEGFGYPPIESAYCQTPVLLYKNSSLKELFKNDYPYTKKGKELKTLEFILKRRIDPKKFLRRKFLWQEAVIEFIKLYDQV
ncbi:MAG: glycosyltransferase family 4 protein [Patescibacteria group bacterium]|nr:glycosyltransferase family 4 protein [Patescibacteria group bacterium]